MHYRSVFPVPQRLLDPTNRAFRSGLADFAKGGRYLGMPDAVDLTGMTAATAYVDVTGDAPVFRVAGEAMPAGRGDGTKVRANLFRQDKGWRWIERPLGADAVRTLVSVETSKGHSYCLRLEFAGPVTLARYPDLPAEPRLRPTTHGVLHLGEPVGSILLRGRERVVHGLIVVAKAGFSLTG